MKVSSIVRIKVKGKECREQAENSDNDFESRKIEVGEGSRVRNKPEKHKKAENIVKPPRKVAGIRTRTSPMILYQTVADLNDEQQKAVKEMGLDCLIGMTVNGIPSKHGFFVVNNLDTDSPIGGLDLMTMDNTDEGAELAGISKRQYKKESHRPTDVMNEIQSTTDASLMFKLNFLVLFVNSMAECSRMGCCAVNFLHCIKCTDTISSINWSGYIFDCMKRSQPSNMNHENTTPSPPSKENKEDEEAVKKFNGKFGLLMRTKVDAHTVIEKAKERFPSESIFERYEDELAILFNETGFRGSGKNKQPTTLVGCSHSSKNNQQSDPVEKHNVLRTPTKLNFNQVESLDALSPLSPYWYNNQTTYGLIDAEIQEKLQPWNKPETTQAVEKKPSKKAWTEERPAEAVPEGYLQRKFGRPSYSDEYDRRAESYSYEKFMRTI
ncbi:hypothetical protein L6452_32805 [Arctium lappa]|uniref:Uncharacterized protein n=1 Tax=Arctium lappa TaxID=4217 RepID=A0ACB8Z6U1_ARCLA|nr:hypothetical protein L6452_32805 [Arctium lappa]